MEPRKPPAGRSPDLTHPHMRGLVGGWTLSERAGSTVWDYSGRGRHGTLTGMAPASDWVEGVHGPALDFDGVDDWIDFGASGWTAILTGGAFSLAAWFEAGTAPGTNQFRHAVGISQNFGSTSGYIGFGTTGTGNNFKLLSGGETPGSGTALTAGTWHWGCITWDGSQVRPYLDGELDYAAFAPTGSNWQTGTTLALCREMVLGSAHHYHNRRASDLRVYARTLTADEIADMYRRPFAAWHRPASVVALYPVVFVGTVTGSGAGVIAEPTASGSGTIAVTGSGAGAVAEPTASGSGTIAAPSVTGSGAGVVSEPTASGSGTIAIAGSGVALVASPVASGSGSIEGAVLDVGGCVLPMPQPATCAPAQASIAWWWQQWR